MKATILLLDSSKLGDFYFAKDSIVSLAQKYLDEGWYNEAGTLDIHYANEPGSVEPWEDACEECFDLTNNPSRQAEREETYGRGRSVSVGDMVKVDGERYVCASVGWMKV